MRAASWAGRSLPRRRGQEPLSGTRAANAPFMSDVGKDGRHLHFIRLLLFHLDGQGGGDPDALFLQGGLGGFSANFIVQGVFAPLPPL